MCTVGGGPDIGEVETLVAKDYECLDCNNKFQGMGRRPMCPSCKSRNVKADSTGIRIHTSPLEVYWFIHRSCIYS